jgi:hypothetical protein
LDRWQAQHPQQLELELELEGGQQDSPSGCSVELEMYPLQNQHHCGRIVLEIGTRRS